MEGRQDEFAGDPRPDERAFAVAPPFANGHKAPLSELEIARVHAQLRQLAEEERKLLIATKPEDAQEVQERFFHHKMTLIMQLPPEQQEPYHPQPIVKLGTVRDDANEPASGCRCC
jgi:hypothetical protein